MEPQHGTSSGCLYLFSLLELLWHLGSWISFVSCWEPRWGIYISSVNLSNVVLLYAAVMGQSRWFVLCVAMWQSHCTLMLNHGDCPIANKGLCELAFCTQRLPSLLGVINMSKKGMAPLLSLIFCCELYMVVYGINVFQEIILLWWLNDGKGVINKPFPKIRRVWCRS